VEFIDDIFKIEIPEDVLNVIKEHIDTVKETKSFPIDFNKETGLLKVLAQDYLDYNVKQIWKLLFKANDVQICTTYPEDINKYIITEFGKIIGTEVKGELGSTAQQETALQNVTLDTGSTSKVAKFLNEVLEYAVDLEASDIHVEPLPDRVRIRFRVDGVLHEKFQGLSKQILPELITRIKILAKLRIDETRRPQDGRIFIKLKGKEFDLRVATSPTIHGEKAVIRLLPKQSRILKIEETGLRDEALKRFRKALSLTAGIILITGPTGSGKTTTLATALHYLNKPEVNIITIEDPVEIVIPGVSQIQVKSDIGLTFSSILRSVVRQDPDIIMVGEIRDAETAELAIHAALTGHLVLSTLHTNNSAGAFTRLMEMGIEPYLLTSTVKLVISQRLVRTICPYSRTPYLPSIESQQFILEHLQDIPNFDIIQYLEKLSKERQGRTPDDPRFRLEPPITPPVVDPKTNTKRIYLYKGEPHPKCGGLPYKGRTGIFEALWVSKAIRAAILKQASMEEIEKIAKQEGMLTFFQDGLLKTVEGITTLKEVERVGLI